MIEENERSKQATHDIELAYISNATNLTKTESKRNCTSQAQIISNWQMFVVHYIWYGDEIQDPIVVFLYVTRYFWEQQNDLNQEEKHTSDALQKDVYMILKK